MSNLKLELWDSVQTTDPKYTKAFTKGGGFSGTAINAIYQIKRATEHWGPIGGDWGYDIVASDYIQGAVGDVIHVLQIKFRHPKGSFAVFGQTTFVGKNKNGAFTDEEAPKKSLTDAITKALSMLGFSADVFLGLYDDNKYVNDLKNQAAKPLNTPTQIKKDEFDALPVDQQKTFSAVADKVRAELDKGNGSGGYELYAEFKETLEGDAGLQGALRSLFNSAESAILTKEYNSRKGK